MAVSMLFWADGARGADGIVEINQVCAADSGCFVGDTPGLPVQITGAAGRSYVLTGDLAVTDVNTNAITLSGTIRGLTIDLGGFTIQGPVVCTGTPAVCSASGSGNGVQALGPNLSGVRVHNGTIRGMGGRGVALAADCVVEQLNALENAGGGVAGGTACRVERVTASVNGTIGVGVTDGSAVRQVTARRNGSVGIFASSGSTVTGSVATDNGLDGIQVSDTSVVSDVLTSTNTSNGIRAGDGSVVRGVMAYGNGVHGVFCQQGCTVQAVAARNNAEFGLSFLDQTGSYSVSSMTNNTSGGVNSGTARGGNLCTGPNVVSPPDCN